MSEYVLGVAERLIGWEAETAKLKWPDARASVARQAGVAPGTLERLERGRLKFADRIGAKLDRLLIALTERQIAALEREKQMALARERDRNKPEFDLAAIDAALSTARALIRRG